MTGIFPEREGHRNPLESLTVLDWVYNAVIESVRKPGEMIARYYSYISS